MEINITIGLQVVSVGVCNITQVLGEDGLEFVFEVRNGCLWCNTNVGFYSEPSCGDPSVPLPIVGG